MLNKEPSMFMLCGGALGALQDACWSISLHFFHFIHTINFILVPWCIRLTQNVCIIDIDLWCRIKILFHVHALCGALIDICSSSWNKWGQREVVNVLPTDQPAQTPLNCQIEVWIHHLDLDHIGITWVWRISPIEWQRASAVKDVLNTHSSTYGLKGERYLQITNNSPHHRNC